MKQTPSIHVTGNGPVTTITIDRPDRHNSFDVETMRSLHAAVQDAVDDESTRAVILTGRGRAFCTGADVQRMHEEIERAPRHIDELTLASHATVEAIRQAPKPFIAAVNGVAAGGGVGLALAADLIVMAESARFVLAFSKLGLSPDCGATAALTHTLGCYRTREAILIDEGITAQQALEWGLVNRVASDQALLETAGSLAEAAAARAGHAVQATKALVRLAQSSPVESILEAERRAIIQGASTPAFREGVQVFMSRRTGGARSG